MVLAVRRVLILEDDSGGREDLRRLLELWGHEVHVAGDWARALALSLSRRPDAVVMDLRLRDGDALYAIRRIKADCARVRVIAFSGWHEAEVGARAAGADAFVLKPDLDGLERLLRELPPRAAEAAPGKKDRATSGN